MVFTFIPRHQKVLMLTLKKMTDKQSNPSYVGVQELAQTLVMGLLLGRALFWVFCDHPRPEQASGGGDIDGLLHL